MSVTVKKMGRVKAAIAKGSSPRTRRSQADRREQARLRILDAAEELFAKRGFHGVTLRDVATAALTDTALLHYYFGGKAELFEAVIGRRAGLVDRVRSDSLTEYEHEHGDAMTAEGILRAYLEPTFEFMTRGDHGMVHYGALIAKVNATADSDEMLPSIKPFESVVHKLLGMLARIRPDYSDTDLYWFYHLLSGAITLSLAQTGRIEALSGGKCRSDDFAAILGHMVRVFGQGFSALRSDVAGTDG